MKDLLIRYQLPKKVKVLVTHTEKGGFVAEFPDLPGCFTQGEDLFEIYGQVTDAILTYFDVPRKDSNKITYLPEENLKAVKESVPKRIEPASAKFDLFIAA